MYIKNCADGWIRTADLLWCPKWELYQLEKCLFCFLSNELFYIFVLMRILSFYLNHVLSFDQCDTLIKRNIFKSLTIFCIFWKVEGCLTILLYST